MRHAVLRFDDLSAAPVLRTPARQVVACDLVGVVPLAAEMLASLDGLAAVGLAAPQVGVPLAFFVEWSGPLPRVVVNPTCLVRADFCQVDEGCLSLPGVEARPWRPGWMVVEASLLVGYELVPQRFELSGFTAQVFDHEIDHLLGVSMLDRVGRPPH